MNARKIALRAKGPGWFFPVLLVFLLGLTLFRCRTVFATPPRLDGYREAVFVWAYRDRSLGALFGKVEPSLRFGEVLWITVPASGPQYEPGWFKVMANYAWPYQTVLEVSPGPPRKGFGGTVVVFEESGSVRIVRF